MHQEDLQVIQGSSALSQENGTEQCFGDNSLTAYADAAMQQGYLNNNHDSDVNCQGGYCTSVVQRPETLPTHEITNPLSCYPSSNCYDSSCFNTAMFTPSEISYMSPIGAFYPAAALSSHSPYAFTPMPTLVCSPDSVLHNGAFYPSIMPCMSSPTQIYQSPTTVGNMHFTSINSEGVMLPFDKMDLSGPTELIGNCDSVAVKMGNKDNNGFEETDGKGDGRNHILHPQSDNILHSNIDGTSNNGEENTDTSANEYFVMVHVNGGETFSVKIGGQLQNIQGPATVRMVSKKGPPMVMPMQVPPGHLVQQIVDENGVLTHIILSPLPPTASLQQGPTHQMMFPMTVPYPSAHQEGDGAFASGVVHDGRYAGAQISADISGATGECGDNLLNGVHSWIEDSITQHQHHRGGWNSKQPAENTASRIRVQRKKTKNNHTTNSKTHVLQVGRRSEFHATSSSGEETNVAMGLVNEEKDEAHPRRSPTVATMKPSATNTTSVIRKIVNFTPPPQISEIEAKSVLVQLYPPDCPEDASIQIDPSDFTYELFLSENGPDAYYKCVFRGDATEILIKDLKPNLEYCVKAATRYRNIVGNRSSPVRFKTEPSEPNAPKQPILVLRTRCELALKWTNTIDNGSKIESFILEFKEANDATSEWVEMYNGPQHYCKVNKLKPSTEYVFRLCATNAYGHSPWSEEVMYSTCGLAPCQPLPPKLMRQEVHGLGLSWNKRPIEDRFTLEMEDEATCHGFIPVFMGDQLSHFFDNLRRNTRYRFRLAAENNEGRSQWSDVVTYSTLPDAPSPPQTLEVKRKPQATKFQICWTKPEDDGGAPVDLYRLQACYCAASSPLANKEASSMSIDDSVAWLTVYEGSETSGHVKNATPGSVVWLRVSAHSIGGWGKWSLPTRIRLPSAAPGMVIDLRTLLSKSTYGNTLKLIWKKPENDGGADTLIFEVQERLCMPSATNAASNTDDNEGAPWRTIYEGSENECSLQHSVPGCEYHYRVRAKNELDLVGPWCEPTLKVNSEPSQPLAPGNVVAQWFSAKRCFHLSWEVPEKCNGSPVLEYRVEMRSAQLNTEYIPVYSGNEQRCEVHQNLLPATAYIFRVQALNAAGYGPFSTESQPCYTGCNPPGIVSSVNVAVRPSNKELEVALNYLDQLNDLDTKDLEYIRALLIDPDALPRPDSLWVSWSEAPSNGSDITNYLVEWNTLDGLQNNFQCLVTGQRCFHIIENLIPQCTYRVRIQAQNAEGNGSFSAYKHGSTISTPPSPPVIECTLKQVSLLKLRWFTTSASFDEHSEPSTNSQSSSSAVSYQLDMSRSPEERWHNAYSGTGNTHKVQRLNEDTEYLFRIRALNKTSVGNWSPVYRFSTAKAPPPHPRTLKLSEATATSACIEWSPVNINSTDYILYVLQILNVSGNELEYKQVYRGSDTSFCVLELEPATEYLGRVCSVRVRAAPSSSNQLQRGSELQDEYSLTSQDASALEPPSDSDTKTTTASVYKDVDQLAKPDIIGPFSPPFLFTTLGGLRNVKAPFSMPVSSNSKASDAYLPKRRRLPPHTANIVKQPAKDHQSQQVNQEMVAKAQKNGIRECRLSWLEQWRSHVFTDTEVSAFLLFAFVLLLILVGFLAQCVLV